MYWHYSSILFATCCSNAFALPEDWKIRGWDDRDPTFLKPSTDGYAPKFVDCPSTRPVLRTAHGLSIEEQQWLNMRRPRTVDPMKDLLQRLKIDGFDAVTYINNHAQNFSSLPNIAIAASGGGLRALTSGAGAVKAFDSRTPNSTSPGQLGGLLQSATYIAGLSGGSWLVGSMYVNNFSTIDALQNEPSGSLWEFGSSPVTGPKKPGIALANTADYFKTIVTEVNSKREAGFDSSITDFWGRAISFQLVNATNGGPGITWSSLAGLKEFKNGDVPMPIALADERAPGEKIIAANATNFEFNPFEFGSFDPTLYGFAPMKFIGSRFGGGFLPNDQKCVNGYDNAGFVMGTSSSLFNKALTEVDKLAVPNIAKTLLKALSVQLGLKDDDIAAYAPNPFFGFRIGQNPSASNKQLTLVDGGEDKQNIPFNPLIQPARAVDVIFALDNSADTIDNWPDGSALIATFERSRNETMMNGTAFPAIPDNNTFVNLGLNTRPTFFGCDPKNQSGPSPLIVYIPNTPYTFLSNRSTADFIVSNDARDKIIDNGYLVATMANGTVDKTWPTCVGCAILSRSMDRTGTEVPAVCKSCFQRFCYDGKLAPKPGPNPLMPKFILTEVKAASGSTLAMSGLGAVLVVLSITLSTLS